MTEETRKHLILGGGLIAAVILGIVVYKKYQVGSQANQAASDQAQADQLAYIESMALQSPYAYGGGGGGTSITAPTPPAMPSITDELSSIAAAFGLAPASAAPGGSSPTPAKSTSTPSAPSGATPTTHTPAANVYTNYLLSSEPAILRQEGVLVA